MLRSMMQDARYTVRQWRRAPGFAMTVVAVLGLGVSANVAVFTPLNGILLRPLPYSHPAALAAASFLAAWLPARRAAAVDPILALRSE